MVPHKWDTYLRRYGGLENWNWEIDTYEYALLRHERTAAAAAAVVAQGLWSIIYDMVQATTAVRVFLYV